MSKIFLDYGHGGSDPGAIGNGVREKDLTLQIGKKVARLLRNSKQKVVESRTTDKYLSLAQRTRLANNSNADVFVSIHINLFTRATAHGVETFNHTGSKNGAKLAKDIQDELVKTGLFRSNRGVKTANFYVIRNTRMPAALTELGFISNKEDVKVMTTKQDELAQAIANGILKYLGQGTVKSTTSKPSKPAPKPKPSKKSNSAIAREVLAGKWGNNPKRKQDLIKAGYNYNAIQAEVNRLAGGTSKPSKPKPKPSKSSKPKASLAVDGKWGKGTTRALQKALGTPVDGIISRQPRNSVSRSLYGGTVHFGSGGSMVIRALQRKINVNADGKLGPATARALQKYLGTVQDGKLSRPSLVVKEMQRRLNNGTF